MDNYPSRSGSFRKSSGRMTRTEDGKYFILRTDNQDKHCPLHGCCGQSKISTSGRPTGASGRPTEFSEHQRRYSAPVTDQPKHVDRRISLPSHLRRSSSGRFDGRVKSGLEYGGGGVKSGLEYGGGGVKSGLECSGGGMKSGIVGGGGGGARDENRIRSTVRNSFDGGTRPGAESRRNFSDNPVRRDLLDVESGKSSLQKNRREKSSHSLGSTKDVDVNRGAAQRSFSSPTFSSLIRSKSGLNLIDTSSPASKKASVEYRKSSLPSPPRKPISWRKTSEPVHSSQQLSHKASLLSPSNSRPARSLASSHLPARLSGTSASARPGGIPLRKSLSSSTWIEDSKTLQAPSLSTRSLSFSGFSVKSNTSKRMEDASLIYNPKSTPLFADSTLSKNFSDIKKDNAFATGKYSTMSTGNEEAERCSETHSDAHVGYRTVSLAALKPTSTLSSATRNIESAPITSFRSLSDTSQSVFGLRSSPSPSYRSSSSPAPSTGSRSSLFSSYRSASSGPTRTSLYPSKKPISPLALASNSSVPSSLSSIKPTSSIQRKPSGPTNRTSTTFEAQGVLETLAEESRGWPSSSILKSPGVRNSRMKHVEFLDNLSECEYVVKDYRYI